MNKSQIASIALAAFSIAATPAFSQEAKPEAAATQFKIGSAAPAFKPTKWLQGEPVTELKKDTTYIVECGATWCGPCMAAIPHINELNNKYKDKGLVVVSVNVWEKESAKMEAVIKEKGDGLTYRVAFDDGAAGGFADLWLKAAGVRGIPHTFVVKNNTLIWQGHPASLDDKTVSSMLDGTFDVEKAAAAAEIKQKMNTLGGELRALLAAKKTDEAEAKLAEMVKIGPDAGISAESLAQFEKSVKAKIAAAKGE